MTTPTPSPVPQPSPTDPLSRAEAILRARILENLAPHLGTEAATGLAASLLAVPVGGEKFAPDPSCEGYARLREAILGVTVARDLRATAKDVSDSIQAARSKYEEHFLWEATSENVAAHLEDTQEKAARIEQDLAKLRTVPGTQRDNEAVKALHLKKKANAADFVVLESVRESLGVRAARPALLESLADECLATWSDGLSPDLLRRAALTLSCTPDWFRDEAERDLAALCAPVRVGTSSFARPAVRPLSDVLPEDAQEAGESLSGIPLRRPAPLASRRALLIAGTIAGAAIATLAGGAWLVAKKGDLPGPDASETGGTAFPERASKPFGDFSGGVSQNGGAERLLFSEDVRRETARLKTLLPAAAQKRADALASKPFLAIQSWEIVMDAAKSLCPPGGENVFLSKKFTSGPLVPSRDGACAIQTGGILWADGSTSEVAVRRTLQEAVHILLASQLMVDPSRAHGEIARMLAPFGCRPEQTTPSGNAVSTTVFYPDGSETRHTVICLPGAGLETRPWAR